MKFSEVPEEAKRGYNAKAKKLSVGTKKVFHQAFFKKGMTVGESGKKAGIGDRMVAVALLLQLHKTIHIPMTEGEIA